MAEKKTKPCKKADKKAKPKASKGMKIINVTIGSPKKKPVIGYQRVKFRSTEG